MAFRARQETRANTLGREETIWILEGDGLGRLEIWPAMGFNAYRWNVAGEEMLYCDPAFFDEVKPTRSGWPILFPFPNRIRDGRFTWDGKTYQLPLNDPSGKNAIHGFVATRPWRVVGHGVEATQAWVTAEFHGLRDGGDVTHLWPGDFRIRITYRLLEHELLIDAVVDNPGTQPLPFGLGYHPYFRVAPFGGFNARIGLPRGKEWELDACLPTSMLKPRKAVCDSTEHWQSGRPFAELLLDNLFTQLDSFPEGDEPKLRGRISTPSGPRCLSFLASSGFRELVAFTPPHREAICFEPYTCATDAINLQQRGFDAGLKILAPGERWVGGVHVLVDVGKGSFA